MREGPTIFQQACLLHDETRLPAFPVRLFQTEDGRWQKQPLVKWGSVSGVPHELVWHEANAIGVPMGRRSGLIAIDLDDYKDGSEADQWLRTHHVPKTRTHSTASGGRHLIFRLPAGLEISNKAPAVSGLDIRGNGGFIVWSDVAGHYSVLDNAAPALLPDSICAELLALQSPQSGRPLFDADLPELQYVSSDDLARKLNTALSEVTDNSLRARFAGSTKGLKDKSRSGMDMSLASLLAARGFDFSEIAWTLLGIFQHGTADRDGQTVITERAASRCAARALQHQANKREAQAKVLRQTLCRLQTFDTSKQGIER